MSFKQEKHDIVMKHDEENKKGPDLATALEEDQAAHILHGLSEVHGHLEEAAHIFSNLKVDKAAIYSGAGHPGMRFVERIGKMEKMTTKTTEKTLVLYELVDSDEENKKLKQKTEKFVRKFD